MDWFECDGHTIYVTGTGHQEIVRWHDAEGRATKTILTVSFPGEVFTLSPTGDGPHVTLRTRTTFHYDYLEPGVRASRILRKTGAQLVVTGGGRVIAQEVGWIEFEPGAEEEIIADYRGQQDVLDDFDGFVEDVCAVLLG